MKITKAIIGVLALLASAVTCSAAAINITVDANGNYMPDGTDNSANSLASNDFYASFNSGSTSNDEASNLNFLSGVVYNWNNAPLTGEASPYNPRPLPTPVLAGNYRNENFSGNTYTTLAGYDYVVFHFGAGGQDTPDGDNGWWAAWYLGGDAATINRPTVLDDYRAAGGFSSATYYNGRPTTVPDGGSTFLAFGIGLLGLGGVRRFLLKA